MKKLITCLTVCVLSGATFATTWTVDDDGKADFDNIQAAVDAASDGDEIVVMPGTYTSTQDGHVVNMQGKAVTLRSSDPSDPDVVAATIIDGEGARRGIACFNNETSITFISGFTVTNGYGVEFDYDGNGEHDYESGCGCGMYNYGSSPTLEDCTFENNTANNYGGGMYNRSSSPTLTDCTFENNSAGQSGSGGGMYSHINSSPTLTNCTFDSNTAFGGGGMCNYQCNPIVINCAFSNNYAYRGGGMRNDTYTGGSGARPTLIDCVFNDNYSESSGGGIDNYGNSHPTLTGCILNNNSAGTEGGGIASSYVMTSLTNTIVCGNSPDQIYGPFSDDGSNTIGDACPWNQGACCTNDICVDSQEDVCNIYGGSWLGEGTTCVENPCLTSCLGDVTGDGQVNVSDLLVVISVWGACQ